MAALGRLKPSEGGDVAHRSYLYSLCDLPEAPGGKPGKVEGVSEWRYKLPPTYMALASGNTRAVPSRAFSIEANGEREATQPLALVGDRAIGEARLRRLLTAIAQVTSDDGTRESWEAAEIDSITSSDFQGEVEAHLTDIRVLAVEIDALSVGDAVQRLQEDGPRYTLLAREAEDDPFDPVELGLDEWTDVLWAMPADAASASPT